MVARPSPCVLARGPPCLHPVSVPPSRAGTPGIGMHAALQPPPANAGDLARRLAWDRLVCFASGSLISTQTC